MDQDPRRRTHRVAVAEEDLAELSARVTDLLSRAPTGRVLLGLAGEPGAGKSTLASALASRLDARTAVVPLDGFHLADRELERQGLLRRKGVPETFDAWGYAALLERLRARPDHTVYAPGFERDLEQPLAGAIAVPHEVEVVLTEGNYLLLDRPEWAAGRARLDEAWYVGVESDLRRTRLVERHVLFGKAQAEAERWVAEVDDGNAALVAESRHRADLVVELSSTGGSPQTGSRSPTAP